MNFIEYEKEKVKALSAEQVCWKLFKLTGQINYYMLFNAINSVEKEQQWENTKSQE